MRDFSQVSKTALSHIFFRSLYGIPYADRMAELLDAKRTAQELLPAGLQAQLEMAPIMEARYKGGEGVLEKLITEYPTAQVLELAGGFSLHGTVLAEKYPSILYIDSDYDPSAVELKKQVIQEELMQPAPSNLQFLTINALDPKAISELASRLDHNREILIYNEGLMAYLTKPELSQLAINIKSLLQQFDGAWITPDPALSTERRVRIASVSPSFSTVSRAGEKLSGQAFAEYGFSTEADADTYFTDHGLVTEKVGQPTGLTSFTSANLEPKLVTDLTEDIKNHGKVWVLRI